MYERKKKEKGERKNLRERENKFCQVTRLSVFPSKHKQGKRPWRFHASAKAACAVNANNRTANNTWMTSNGNESACHVTDLY